MKPTLGPILNSIQIPGNPSLRRRPGVWRDGKSRRPRSLGKIQIALLVVILSLFLSGCSKVGLAYNSADYFIKSYVQDYLDLEPVQIDGWQPLLDTELGRHRAEELPYLASFIDQLLTGSRVGFDDNNMECILRSFRVLYKRQARFAVKLTTPLLATLTPTQIEALEKRFNQEDAEDLDKAKQYFSAAKLEKRHRRLVKSLEDWTGPLQANQKAMVVDFLSNMPDIEPSRIHYRQHKRAKLIDLLRVKAGQQALGTYLTDWIVDFSDAPPDLNQGMTRINKLISALFIQLGTSLDESQRARLDDRLKNLRDDLMKLQEKPQMATISCQKTPLKVAEPG